MNLDGLEAIIELIEMGAMSSNRDIAKCLRGAVAVLKEQEQKLEWIGLTDEEMETLYYGNADTITGTERNFGRAVEAKLREKNA